MSTPPSPAFDITGVCLVGCGNAAHTCMALLPSGGIKNLRVYSTMEDEINKLNTGLKNGDGNITASFADHLNVKGSLVAKPDCITSDPEEALKGVNVILCPLPSFAFDKVFTELKPFIKAGTYICVSPGQGGVDWIAKKALGEELFSKIFLFALCPMPFNCRVEKFGQKINIQAFKSEYLIAITPSTADSSRNACSIVWQTFGICGNEKGFLVESMGHFASATLYPLNPCIHPQRLYTLFKDYKEGDVTENPLFYEEMTKEATDMMECTSDEIQSIARKIETLTGQPLNVPTILQSEINTWPGGKDSSPQDILEIFRTSVNYKGFRCPVKPEGSGFRPDFTNRYFTEDIPFGLCVLKGIADIVGEPVPVITEMIVWAQGHLKKEYVANGTLSGKDVGETTAPQAFGFDTVEKCLHLEK